MRVCCKGTAPCEPPSLAADLNLLIPQPPPSIPSLRKGAADKRGRSLQGGGGSQCAFSDSALSPLTSRTMQQLLQLWLNEEW